MKVGLLCGLFCLAIVSIPVCASSVEIIGHRGASYVAPENTLMSVNTAWKLGADAAEIDVHLTKDNRIVVIHDDTTEKTAGVDLKVSETTAETLRKLDVGRHKGEEFTGEKIPFLEDIIATIPPGRMLFVEIKCGKEILPSLQQVLTHSGKLSQIIIISFDLDTVAASKELMPRIPTYWIKGTDEDEQTKKRIPHSLELIQMTIDKKLDGLDVDYRGISKSFVDAVKASGLKLYVWTVNDLDEAKQLKEFGVDGITTDRPGWLLKHL